MLDKQNYIGYARVSTSEQNVDMQLDALKQYNCIKIFHEYISGTRQDRPELNKALEYLQPNNVLVIWKLDRLGRSLKNLIDIVNNLNERNIHLISIQEHIDTTTSTGRLIFHMFGAMAEFERGIIRDRVMAGLKSARARGHKGGRPTKMTDEKIEKAQQMWESRKWSIKEICKILEISDCTLYRNIDTKGG